MFDGLVGTNGQTSVTYGTSGSYQTVAVNHPQGGNPYRCNDTSHCNITVSGNCNSACFAASYHCPTGSDCSVCGVFCESGNICQEANIFGYQCDNVVVLSDGSYQQVLQGMANFIT